MRLFLNRVPGQHWDQNRPETITEALFTEPRERFGQPVGLTFVFSYLNGPLPVIATALERLLALAEKTETPTLLALDGQNWWDYRAELWNGFDPSRPGYDPKNRHNVEWSGPGPEHALELAWRNWGRQIRVVPPPNLGGHAFRTASKEALRRLLPPIHAAVQRRPELFPGVKLGWETSIGINAFTYPGGNTRRTQPESGDPTTGLDLTKDFAGGLPPLGYAARTSLFPKRTGPITLADHEAIVRDYIHFLVGQGKAAGLSRRQLFTHAGGQYAPWEKHVSHATALHRDATPGWSLYFTLPESAGDLPRVVGQGEGCVSEWLPAAETATQWQAAFTKTVGFARCRFVALYNYEGIRDNAAALAGLRAAASV